ncbi:NAD(P)/FAD-dependent oxidoreductase [Parablautia muri]|uniref:FAD-dependent oxidoreductase n=1 Tax=Parablautia muri TaxID=2320879 RepID=A0A9X5BEG2_9FIRM|nr:FAD-dependent oxidoreductase [Parablautia muri]NBJ92132.1 FAD-dependent oxidoreductase [Parablautia muri]
MLRINQLKLPVGHNPSELMERVKKLLRWKDREAEPEITIVRRSIDARKKPELYFNYVLNIQVKDQAAVYGRCDKKQVTVWKEKPYRFPVTSYKGNVRPVVIGTGPAGLFCGYMLAKAGFRPILLERGEAVEQRVKDVQEFWESGKLNPESNVQFGEGGAGTFSDGKLNTLVKDKYGRNQKVLSLLVEAGALEEILYDHKPHIGTDELCKIVAHMRQDIIHMGGEVHFGAKVTDLICREGCVAGVIINGSERLEAKYVVLAPGHSARDVFRMLYEKDIALEAKPFAVGVRVEHPQELMNLAQYGSREVKDLGNAPYKVTARTKDGRGVYSFCMCPGGYVVNASSQQGRLAVNGMSYSKRDGSNANSAIIVTVTPEDYGQDHPLSGVEFQQRLEEKAFQVGDGVIPVERYGDYRRALTQRDAGLPSSYLIPEDFTPAIKGKWRFAPVHEILPKELGLALVEGMEQFGKTIKGFNDINVLMEGVESRTSSPVRILRDEKLQSSLKGLYPCGEGAGYAGGITSAAMDGIRVAEEVAVAIASQS